MVSCDTPFIACAFQGAKIQKNFAFCKFLPSKDTFFCELLNKMGLHI